MKYRTTDKEQRENNAIILGFSYCDIQNIERFLKPNAYTCGMYGWRADFYEFDGFTISTGYSPLRYISLTGYKDIDAYRKTKAAILQEGFKKIEGKLNKGGYKWQNSGSWDKCHNEIMKVINRLIHKANKAAGEEAAKYYKK
jgi:hypothetical protein